MRVSYSKVNTGAAESSTSCCCTAITSWRTHNAHGKETRVARENSMQAKEPAIAVSLALLLDGRRQGLTLSQIMNTGALLIDDRPESDATLRKRFERARARLGQVGIVISIAPGSEAEQEPRYVLDAGLSYSAEQSVQLSGEQALRLSYLLAICEQADLPFRDDLERARLRLTTMMRVEVDGDASAPGLAPAASSHAGLPTSDGANEPALDVISDAYAHAHPIEFSYVNAHGEPSRRTVAVYGLFTHRAHTYVVGFDEGRRGVRVFRVGRIATEPAPAIDTRRTYAVPADFSLSDYRHLPFQYGEEPFIATFRDTRGMTDRERSALTQDLGSWEIAKTDVASHDRATWTVEASDVEEAARWSTHALSTNGLLPISPERLVSAVRDGLERTVRIHG